MILLLFFLYLLLLLYSFKFKRIVTLYSALSVSVYLQLEFCNYNTFQTLEFKYIILGIVFIFITYIIPHLLLNNFLIVSCCVSTLYFILAIVNCYVYQFRNIPLIPTDIEIAPTAFSILGHYSISLTKQSIIGIAIFFINIITIVIFSKQSEQKRRTYIQVLKNMFLSILLVFVIQVPFMEISKPYINIITMTWSVQHGYWQYGYLLGSIKNLKETRITKPSGYENINQIVKNMDKSDNINIENNIQYPDIVLIINESYFDLRTIANITTNKNPTEYIDSLTNTIKGYVVNPNTVTANSEYEILTSNSLQLLSGITAFTHFSSNKANSIVKNLKELNYETYAIHPAPKQNYNRVSAYPELGFDNLYWNTDLPQDYMIIRDFPSDKACFDKIVELYELPSEKTNKFIYNLTLQNHGDYNKGIDKNIEILSGVDDSKKALAEEYLNSLNYTDNAFKELIEYFKNVERPVIVCMIGDHSPNFSGEIISKTYSSNEERSIVVRSTPFLLWCNYPIEPMDIGNSSMIYVESILFKSAGLPLTAYQKYLSTMQEFWPIVTLGICGDGKSYYSYENSNIPNYELLENYFCIEYHNLMEDESSIYNY